MGNRLRPLTGRLPKPLVPLFHRPLAEWAIAACAQVGIGRFAINTHHLPEAWNDFGAGNEVTLFHEPILLETGGGLKNIEPWMGDEPLLVHNGDIFSTMPLEKLIAAHEASGLPVTLALRSEGTATHIALDPTGTRVADIRQMLGGSEGTHVFSGIMLDDMGLSGGGGNRQPDNCHEKLQNHQYRILRINQARDRRPREVVLRRPATGRGDPATGAEDGL